MPRALENTDTLCACFAVAEGNLRALLEWMPGRVWWKDLQRKQRVLVRALRAPQSQRLFSPPVVFQCIQLLLSTSHPHALYADIALSHASSRAGLNLVFAASYSSTILQELTLPTLDAPSLLTLAALPHLASLALLSYAAPLSPAQLATLLPPEATAFPALRSLAVAAETVTAAFALIVHISSPVLHTLCIRAREDAPGSAWEVALRVLAYLPCRLSLTALELGQSLRATAAAIDKDTEIPEFACVPRSLCSLVRLRCLSVHPPLALALEPTAFHPDLVGRVRWHNFSPRNTYRRRIRVRVLRRVVFTASKCILDD
ncbi:hypothetical protein B0H15DRAFT_954082 [Mycena belliarum]|uniref:Uncharacterized protein n=1 Tax=Mycena belliarum TaxID=1033014 RepID=A0AAD6TZ96_9AGAR|nr:hypothetical protein B0H15DRAFT_954082 [Mycena belliae]